MPTYQYACIDCDHCFDQVQRFTDAALTQCPQCHGSLRKVFSSVGVVFKGSGFYRTDSRASESKRNDKPQPMLKKNNTDSSSAKDSGSASTNTDKGTSTSSNKASTSSTTPSAA